MKINLTLVRPSTRDAAQKLLQELIDEVAEHVADCDEFDATELTGHLKLIEVIKKIALVAC